MRTKSMAEWIAQPKIKKILISFSNPKTPRQVERALGIILDMRRSFSFSFIGSWQIFLSSPIEGILHLRCFFYFSKSLTNSLMDSNVDFIFSSLER